VALLWGKLYEVSLEEEVLSWRGVLNGILGSYTFLTLSFASWKPEMSSFLYCMFPPL
jgi:hypothetical protein